MPIDLSPREHQLDGNWVLDGNRVSGDEVEKRIALLIETKLQKIAASSESGGWETLYRDPADDRYWELTYPRSEMHGGGPKRLANISRDVAILKYRFE